VTDPNPTQADEPRVIHATVRDADDEWHIECRFNDGQKFAAVRVDKGHEALADFIAKAIIAPAPDIAAAVEKSARSRLVACLALEFCAAIAGEYAPLVARLTAAEARADRAEASERQMREQVNAKYWEQIRADNANLNRQLRAAEAEREKLRKENVKLRQLCDALSEPPLTPADADKLMEQFKDAPPLSKDEIEQIMTEVKRLSVLPRCSTCGQRLDDTAALASPSPTEARSDEDRINEQEMWGPQGRPRSVK
jgi:hypothetical protein